MQIISQKSNAILTTVVYDDMAAKVVDFHEKQKEAILSLTTVALYTFARGHTVSNPEINLNIYFKARNRKTKTGTNPIPDPDRYRRRCPDPIARIQKFYTFIGTPEKSVHRVTIRNDSPGLVGQGGPNRRSKSMIKLFAK